MVVDTTFKVLNFPIPNEQHGVKRAPITEECHEMERANVNGRMNSNGYSGAFDFSASAVHWTMNSRDIEPTNRCPLVVTGRSFPNPPDLFPAVPELSATGLVSKDKIKGA